MDNLNNYKLDDSSSSSNGISEENDINELKAQMDSVQERTMNMEALNATVQQVCEENSGQATMAQVMENQPRGDISQHFFATLMMAGAKKVKLVGQRGQLLEPHELSVELQQPPPEED
ncbi:uncharacterized protein LOC127566146 [Drosophila albomicans]|uniref:Uncharacterized protein LOC127566146 n=1 Tax=Drosophila albomicans TaxID=7291 RepID=A0A9C6W8W2_DROAB|nr:uncharacterized protein LOC127566146 [Drosophila albomicans]